MSRIEHTVGESRALSKEAGILIKLLQERRSALISAAVTGKIDVRGWQAAQQAAGALPRAADRVS